MAATVQNCVFVGNSAPNGGGAILIEDRDPVLVNCTFVGNRTTSNGGAILNTSNEASPRLTNCIVWLNRRILTLGGPLPLVDSIAGGTPLIAYRCIEGGDTLNGNINVDPVFVRNADPGPDWEWDDPEDDLGDLRLAPGSPCVDAGDNTAVSADVADLDDDGDTAEPVPFDLAGNPRFAGDPDTPDTGNGTPPIVDMGAYEGPVVATNVPAFDKWGLVGMSVFLAAGAARCIRRKCAVAGPRERGRE